MLGIFKHLLPSSALDNRALMHHGNVICNPSHQAQVVEINRQVNE